MFKSPLDLGVDRLQEALARRFLQPLLPAIEALFLELRAETDADLGARAQPIYGKPYPLGFCLEITEDVFKRLIVRTARPRSPAERAIKTFLKQGGGGRRVWGVLRERYFQNALQLGSLYIDVANDTVDVNKPKVEILPILESGFVLVRDGAHFATIAERYWNVRMYANTAVPSLAPLLPFIVVDGKGRTEMQTRMLPMFQLLSRDGFAGAERWLRDGPPPPPEVVRAIRGGCPDDLLALDPDLDVEAAVAACRRLRESRGNLDAAIEGMRAMARRTRVGLVVSNEPTFDGMGDPALNTLAMTGIMKASD